MEEGRLTAAAVHRRLQQTEPKSLSFSLPGNGLQVTDNEVANKTDCGSFMKVDSLDAFLERVEKFSLCVSGMAFQDAWNIDLERLRECFIHVVSPDNRIIPFCAFNLTGADGKSLYRSQSAHL